MEVSLDNATNLIRNISDSFSVSPKKNELPIKNPIIWFIFYKLNDCNNCYVAILKLIIQQCKSLLYFHELPFHFVETLVIVAIIFKLFFSAHH